MLTRLTKYLMLGALFLFTTIGVHAEQTPPQPLKIGRGSIEWADWHPDGETIMVSTVNGAWLYTKDLQDLAHIPKARLARFSPDGRYIAGVDDEHTVRLWDAKTFEPVKAFEWSEMHVVRQLMWSPDSHYVAIAGAGGIDEVNIWDIDTGVLQSNIYGIKIDEIKWSPESTYLAGINKDTNVVYVWKPGQGLIFTSDLTYYAEKGIIIWRNNIQLLLELYGEINTITLWDVSTGIKLEHSEIGSTNAISYSPDGNYLASTNNNGGLVIDVSNNEIVFRENPDHATFGTSAIAWRPDGQRIAAGSAFALFSNMASVWIANPFTGEITHTFKDHHRCVDMIRWQPQADYLLSVGCHDELVVHNLTDTGLVYTSLEHTLITTTLAWKDDGSQLAIADTLGNVHIRDTHSGDLLMTLPHPYIVRKLAWQPGGDLLVTQIDDVFLTVRLQALSAFGLPLKARYYLILLRTTGCIWIWIGVLMENYWQLWAEV